MKYWGEVFGLAIAGFLALAFFLVIFLFYGAIFTPIIGWIYKSLILPHWQVIAAVVITFAVLQYLAPCLLTSAVLATSVSGFVYWIMGLLYYGYDLKPNHYIVLIIKASGLQETAVAKAISAYPDRLIAALLIQVLLTLYIWVKDRPQYMKELKEGRVKIRIPKAKKNVNEYVQTQDGKLIPYVPYGFKPANGFDPDGDDDKPNKRRIGFI